MAIAGGLRILEPSTADKAALTSAIRSTRAHGQTPLYVSISTARSFFPAALFELGDVYDEIARELSRQYSLGYQTELR